MLCKKLNCELIKKINCETIEELNCEDNKTKLCTNKELNCELVEGSVKLWMDGIIKVLKLQLNVKNLDIK